MEGSRTSRRQFARSVALAALSASCAPVGPPVHPAAPAAPAAPPPPPEPTEVERIVAELRERYGSSWSEDQVAAVRKVVLQHQQAAEALRRVRLTNADAPLVGVFVPPLGRP